MNAAEPIVERVVAALGKSAVRGEIAVGFEAETVVLEGEVASLADKRRAVALARAASERRVVDRVCVAASAQMRDRAIEAQLKDVLVAEPSLDASSIDVRADCGVVTLSGLVPSLSHKRLAGVLAWWVPGTRDVANRLAESLPSEGRDDAALVLAVRTAIDKDPLVDASRVQVVARFARITLTGAVASALQRRIAERDAFSVLGVEDVANRIAIEARLS